MSLQINGEVVEAIPYNACNEITNKEELEGRIVIAQRGGCMFIDKVMYFEYRFVVL